MRVAFMVFTFANIGLPGTTGFIGEFLTLLGTFQVNNWVAFLATIGTILSACYALYLYRRIIFGVIEKPNLMGIADLTSREVVTLAAAWPAHDLLRRAPTADHRR